MCPASVVFLSIRACLGSFRGSLVYQVKVNETE
jgi:hypothetical protein